MMFVTSPTLSVLALAAIPAIVFPLLAYGRAVRRLSRAAQDRLADASAYAADNLGACATMHAFGQEATVSARFAARRRARLRGGPLAPAGARRARRPWPSSWWCRASSASSGSARVWSSAAR